MDKRRKHQQQLARRHRRESMEQYNQLHEAYTGDGGDALVLDGLTDIIEEEEELRRRRLDLLLNRDWTERDRDDGMHRDRADKNTDVILPATSSISCPPPQLYSYEYSTVDNNASKNNKRREIRHLESTASYPPRTIVLRPDGRLYTVVDTNKFDTTSTRRRCCGSDSSSILSEEEPHPKEALQQQSRRRHRRSGRNMGTATVSSRATYTSTQQQQHEDTAMDDASELVPPHIIAEEGDSDDDDEEHEF